MTQLLMSAEKPDGHKLDELLHIIYLDMILKCKKIENDTSEIAGHVLTNNLRIIGMLIACCHIHHDSMRKLETIGPNQGPTGTPRIGATPSAEPDQGESPGTPKSST